MERVIELEHLYSCEFYLRLLNSIKQLWKKQKSFSCIGNPKEKNLFLFLNHCKARYRLKDGTTYNAKHGDIVYSPVGSEYSLEIYDIDDENGYTFGINFLIYDQNQEPFILADNIKIFHTDKILQYHMIFSKIIQYCSTAVIPTAKVKSLFYELFSFLIRDTKQKKMPKKFLIISKGITYLEESDDLSLSIKEIADMCSVSEIYFRRLFTEYKGVAPSYYKQTSKIKWAKEYLTETNMTVSEIADMLGFFDAAHFSRVFKTIAGVSPKNFAKKESKNFS